ncbi:Ig-like domain-containing protein [Anaerostipes sp.]|uniref:Ig-like domain-containing protein n=1 Tax=Anaerostipes sp. TaxID=1872530 RepID=UPI0025BB2B5C|nr:Ig-like domain-containing protein [Anaerostipes sp.]MBS7008749.1 Ig-like domain-containing protein [Anaerostipes sp.]
MNKKRIRLGILGLVLGLAVIFPAGGKIKAAMKVVEVKKAGQVVDSFQGVDAVYRPGGWDGNDKTYSCAALVKKFYQARYGFTPYNLFAGATPQEYDKGGTFKKVSSPKVGDIASKSTHWAIVQNVSGNNITLLEQNWKWQEGGKTYAKADRVVSKSEMTYFRYYDKNGREISINGSSSGSSAVSSAAKPRTLTINKTSLNVKTRATARLTALIGNKRSGDTVTFSSSNKKIATVSSQGVVTGVKTGTCYVTASVKGTNLSKKCKVTVSLGARSIKLNASRLTLIKIKKYSLKGVIYNKRSNDKLKYKTSNKKIATVSSKGVVKKKKKKGTATITAWIPGTSAKKTCRVTVK